MRSSSLSRIVGGGALVLSCLTSAPTAWAGDAAQAESLFQRGVKDMKEEKFADASAAFEASNAQDPSPGTQINLALSYEKQKKWASAWAWYRSAFGLAKERGQTARMENAKAAAERVEPNIHHVVVAVPEKLQNLVVKRDGTEVTTSVGGKEVPLPIDPGEHTFEVSASGKKPWSKTIHVADTPATERIDVPKLEDAPVEAKPAGAAGGADYQAPVIVANDGSGQRTVGLVVGGAGLLSGLAGIGMFVLAKDVESKRDALNDQASKTSDELQRKELVRVAGTKHDAAKQDELIAIILGGGAAVLVGVGAVLYFTAPKRAEKAAKTQVVPVVTPTFAGLGLGGTF